MTTNFVALGPHCFGFGTDQATAIRNASRHWPRNYLGIKRPKPEHFSVWSSEGEIEVDDMGRVSSSDKLTKLQTSTLAK